jgi:hypothetical protein
MISLFIIISFAYIFQQHTLSVNRDIPQSLLPSLALARQAWATIAVRQFDGAV